MDLHLYCVLQLSLPERSECCGLSGSCLAINKIATLVSSLPSVHREPSALAGFRGWRDDMPVGLPGALVGKSRIGFGGLQYRQALTCSFLGAVEAGMKLPQFHVGTEHNAVKFWLQIICADLQ